MVKSKQRWPPPGKQETSENVIIEQCWAINLDETDLDENIPVIDDLIFKEGNEYDLYILEEDVFDD